MKYINVNLFNKKFVENPVKIIRYVIMEYVYVNKASEEMIVLLIHVLKIVILTDFVITDHVNVSQDIRGPIVL
jgi:hypothetical protein